MRIAVKKVDEFVAGSLRTIDISQKEGIRAIIGELPAQPKATAVQTYIFDADKWNVEGGAKALKWVDENKGKTLPGVLMLYKEHALSDEAPATKINKSYRAKIVKIDKENKIAYAQVTDDAVDRQNEVIALEAWQALKGNYENHPVLLSSHIYHDLLNQIGEAVSIDWDKMVFGFKWYAGEGNAQADWGWKLAERGMAMFSVGFKPFERKTGIDIPKKYKDAGADCVYTKVELLEVSQVIIGCNQGALQLAMDKPDIEEKVYYYDVVKAMADDAPVDTQPAPADAGTPAPAVAPAVATDENILVPLKEYEQIKAGRVLSAENHALISGCVASLNEGIEAMNESINALNILLESTKTNISREGKGSDTLVEVDIETVEAIKRLEKMSK